MFLFQSLELQKYVKLLQLHELDDNLFFRLNVIHNFHKLLYLGQLRVQETSHIIR